MTTAQPGRNLDLPHPDARVLFVSTRTPAEPCDLRQQLSDDGYVVETVGIQEALWLWPIEGYDVLFIDATEQPVGALELCHHVKSSAAHQRVVLMFGDRTGAMPHHFDADAVLCGEPTRDQFLAVVHLLLARGSTPQRGAAPVQPSNAA